MASPWEAWDAWGLDSFTQGYEPLAKDDTLFYGRSATGLFTGLRTDLSQRLTNFTSAATNISEASPSRFTSDGPWCAEVECDAHNTDSGRPFTYGTTAANNFLGLSLTAGTLSAIMTVSPGSTIVVATLALPGIGASRERFVIGWTAEPNPLTTGAANAYRYVLFAYNKTDGAYSQIVYTQVVRSTAAGATIFGAQNAAGTNPFTGTIYAVRLGQGRRRAPPETIEDFVARSAAPTLVLEAPVEYPILDVDSLIGANGEFAGPVYFWGAGSVRANGLRLFSPIVNHPYLNRAEISGDDYSEIPTQYRIAAPDSTYTLLGNYLFLRPVPPTADALRCRVFVKQWRTAGATADRLHFRLYSMNRPPISMDVVDKGEALLARYTGTSIAADHGSGGTDGEWLDLGLLEPALRSDGCTWLALAVRTEDLSGATANQRFEIGSIVVEPGITA